MSRLPGLFLLAGLLAGLVRADVGETNQSAQAMLDRLWAARAMADFSLKARLEVSRDRYVPVEILVHNTPDETRTIYRAESAELLVIQSREGARFFQKGQGELTGARRQERFLDSWVACYDLGLSFLRWPNPQFIGLDRTRGRNCLVIEAQADGEPYARVRLWIDREFHALLRAEAFDPAGRLMKRLTVSSFKRIGEIWVPRTIDFAFIPPGQSLPAEEKSRLEVREGDYQARLPAEWFDPARLAPAPPQ